VLLRLPGGGTTVVAAQILTDEQIADALAELPGWAVVDGALTGTYRAERSDVPPFYLAVAAAEDDADHHARVTILYGTITFALTTHDTGDAITGRDSALAARIRDLAAAHRATPVS
jgi:4a-hydroxytetrahydrobiopterin dehydratase